MDTSLHLFTTHGLPCRPGVSSKKVLTNKMRSEQQVIEKEDCTNKSEAKDKMQEVHERT